jgi:trans-aconitate methyltransferase
VVEVHDRWAVAAAYEAFMGRWSRPVARAFVDWLEVAPRAHWLDVGCGTGALTAAICELKTPASVIACDPSGPLVATASATLPDKRVTFEIAQADHLPERAGAFDVVVSGLVLNFVPNAPRALLAMRTRLAARGCVAAYVWDYAGGMEFLEHFWREAVALDPDAASLSEGVRFAGWNEAALAALFREAGLLRVSTRAIDVQTHFAHFDDYWLPLLGRTGPAPSYVGSLPPERREALRERLLQRLPRQSDGRICLAARAWAARGSSGPAASGS